MSINTNAVKTVLVLGGSFNPIHHTGHVEILKRAYNALNEQGLKVDEAWLMPAAQNPHKEVEGMASYFHRLNMCHLEVEGQPEYLKVSDFENKIEPPYYSYSVLTRLRDAYPNHQFIWLMGSDNLETFHKWEHWRELLQEFPVAVVKRSCSYEAFTNSAAVQEFSHAVCTGSESVLQVPSLRFLDVGELDVRATDIRHKISKNEHTDDISPSVKSYIKKHNLYR